MTRPRASRNRYTPGWSGRLLRCSASRPARSCCGASAWVAMGSLCVRVACGPVVNLYSDTQTRPTAPMRRAMAEAEVGDEQSFADPTVNALCERVASLLGFEAAVFLPTGTMCNAIAFRLHVGPGGDEAYLHRRSHPIVAEAGGPAALSGAVLCPLDGERGMFTADALRAALRPAGDRYLPRSRLVSVEQTTNLAGGHVWPRAQLDDVIAVARDAGLRLHMDGARVMNAVI